MEETAALLRSAAIKTRLAGITELLELLQQRSEPVDGDAEAALIPHVLPCLRDHNAKLAQSALEILELLVRRVPEATVRGYWQLLWSGIAERLGDSKLHVRAKAVDVVVALSEALDIDTVLEKLKPCISHKNWRTREQTLHALWRCLETHDLVNARKSELLDDAIKLLEDSSKEVREAAISTLEMFYAYMGPSLLSDIESKNIRSAHMKMLTEKFQQVNVRSTSSGPSNATIKISAIAPSTSGTVQSDALSSILSSYDIQVDSSSSMARYLASVRNRTMIEASKSAAPESANDDRSPSATSSISNLSSIEVSSGGLGDSTGLSDKEIHKQLAAIFDKLQMDNDWSKRVDGLKSLQKLARQCDPPDHLSGHALITALSAGLKTVRERLSEHVSDLRSSVSREACETIHLLASVMHDDFNPHAEFFIGNLLKATYVTIQVISTSADKSIRGIIESTTNGYARMIPKFLDGARSRNQVLRVNCVTYLTLTLQQWSPAFLSKHLDMISPVLPSILRDAVSEVRAQSRKCYWSLHHLFPLEGDRVFNRLDPSTQKNLRDDPSRTTAAEARNLRSNEVEPVAALVTTVPPSSGRGLRVSTATETAPVSEGQVGSKSSAQRILQSSQTESQQSRGSGVISGPRRVLGGGSTVLSQDDPMDGQTASRVLSQGPKRIGREIRTKAVDDLASSGEPKNVSAGPLRVLSTPKAATTAKSFPESLYTSRQDPQATTAGFHTSSSQAEGVGPHRVQIPTSAESAEGTRTSPSPRSINAPMSPGGLSSHSDVSATAARTKAKAAAASSNNQAQSSQLHSVHQNRVDDALRKMESSSWAVRVEAVESIGKYLQSRAGSHEGSAGDGKQDARIITAFVDHMNDPHYRVSQAVLNNLLPLLKLALSHPQFLANLKVIFPILFQRVIESKESVRAVAKENLDFISSSVDPSIVVSFVIPLLGDGSNMKVKVAVCHYLCELLPGAAVYMKQGSNNSHMRSFLLKIAQLLDGEVPVSVASACGDLVTVAGHHYGPEMENLIPLLPPSKRTVLTKLMNSKGIHLNLISGAVQRKSSSSALLGSAHSRNPADENQTMADIATASAERSRKRNESPTANSSSGVRHSQKRMNTMDTSHRVTQDRSPVNPSNSSSAVMPIGLSFSTTASSEDADARFDHALQVLEHNNANERDQKKALQQLNKLHRSVSVAYWDRRFEHVLATLLDAACEEGEADGEHIAALTVLHKIVGAHGSRSLPFVGVLASRLLPVVGSRTGMPLHLTESTLESALASSTNQDAVLQVLVPFVAATDPPVLQIVLKLVTAALDKIGQRGSPTSSAFLQHSEATEALLGQLAKLMQHSNSSVRKRAVDCLVSLYLTTEHDKSSLLDKYLSAEVDETRRRLLDIYIDRAKRERHLL